MSGNLDKLWEELEKAIKNEEEAKRKGFAEAEITSVEAATLGDIYDEETLDKWGRNADTEVIVIHYKTEWGEDGMAVFTKSTHPRSNLRKFYLQYGRPEPGKRINLVYDKAKDRWKVVL